METPSQLLRLVNRFAANITSYKSGTYNEAQVRTEFIDPFFGLLGWDMNNAQDFAEPFKEVVHEDSLKIGTATKAPDYSFRIGGVRQFFVEAKKPSIFIKHDEPAAYQVRRYAWSAKLALSVLTDFEEFAVYDCRIQPHRGDNPAVARTLYMTYEEYPEKWSELLALFGKEAIQRGSLERYKLDKKKRGTTPVDDAFLDEIESWRTSLARNIALRNTTLSEGLLNSSIQSVIDRIVFLRICEDRGIEQYGQLQSLVDEDDIYNSLCHIFRAADDRYNSGLFHFKKEGNRSTHDTTSLSLNIDDKPLKEIIRNLYYPDSPYEFSVLSSDILGQVYERFLGKVVRLTAGHRAKVEDKPSARRAGGVYYTPSFVVDFIVKSTFDRRLAKRSRVEGSSIRVLDPACGSGSFLITAYQYLLDWYLARYVAQKPTENNIKVYRRQSESWRLTTQERKRILLEHIFGVDIDPTAVEVTKLSLLLKVLEDENKETINAQLRLFRERALPDLDDNIKCGNSIVGDDIYTSQTTLLGDSEYLQANPFNWENAFPNIVKFSVGPASRHQIKDFGFDVIIGNPPYGAELRQAERGYLTRRWPVVADRETSQYFLCAALELSKRGGFLSFIVPNTIFLNLNARRFREWMTENALLVQISDLASVPVFRDASVRTAIPLWKAVKTRNWNAQIVRFHDPIEKVEVGVVSKQSLLNTETWAPVLAGADPEILKRVKDRSKALGEIMEISQGLIPYDQYRGHSPETIVNRVWHATKKKDDTYRRELNGGDVTRYAIRWNGGQWISYGPWLAAPRKKEFFTKPRILVREITDAKTGTIYAAYTDSEYYNNPSIINCILDDKRYSMFFLLGLVNSRLTSYLHKTCSPKARKGLFPKILVDDVRRIAVFKINFDDPSDVKMHGEISELAKRITDLKGKKLLDESVQEVDGTTRMEGTLSERINELVYQLYGFDASQVEKIQSSI